MAETVVSIATLKTLAITLVILIAPFVLYKIEKKNPFEKLLPKIELWKTIKQGLGLFVIMFIILLIEGIILTSANLSDNQKVTNIVIQQEILALIIAVTIGPVAEELLFRGYLLEKIGIIGQAILFAIMHYGYGSISEIIAALSIALLFGYFMRKEKNIYATIFAHAIYNLFTIIAVFSIPIK